MLHVSCRLSVFELCSGNRMQRIEPNTFDGVQLPLCVPVNGATRLQIPENCISLEYQFSSFRFQRGTKLSPVFHCMNIELSHSWPQSTAAELIARRSSTFLWFSWNETKRKHIWIDIFDGFFHFTKIKQQKEKKKQWTNIYFKRFECNATKRKQSHSIRWDL